MSNKESSDRWVVLLRTIILQTKKSGSKDVVYDEKSANVTEVRFPNAKGAQHVFVGMTISLDSLAFVLGILGRFLWKKGNQMNGGEIAAIVSIW